MTDKYNVELPLVGEVHDSIRFVKDGEITLPDGTVHKGKAGELFEMPVQFNLVLNTFPVIVASLIKGQADVFNNIWWEVGEGSSTWDDKNPPAPQLTDGGLLTPRFRKAINRADIKFLHPTSNEVSETPSSKIQIECVFGMGEANGFSLREFSIFMGGTTTLGTGLPINRKTHGAIFKTSGIELHRKIHFYFTGSGN